jgi:hypothetical protein
MNGPSFEIRLGQEIFSSPKRPDRLWGPRSLLLNGYRGSFPGVKRPGSEVDHLPPFSAEIRNGWSYTSTPLHGFVICVNDLSSHTRKI